MPNIHFSNLHNKHARLSLSSHFTSEKTDSERVGKVAKVTQFPRNGAGTPSDLGLADIKVVAFSSPIPLFLRYLVFIRPPYYLYQLRRCPVSLRNSQATPLQGFLTLALLSTLSQKLFFPHWVATILLRAPSSLYHSFLLTLLLFFSSQLPCASWRLA